MSSDSSDSINEVRLRGRISAGPEERILPSGDQVLSFRLVVPRPSSNSIDAIECAAWSGSTGREARVLRSVSSWREGDVVEVSGSLRRRFFRTSTGASSRFEVEVTAGRIITRARATS